MNAAPDLGLTALFGVQGGPPLDLLVSMVLFLIRLLP
jgi:hypothetical protein